MNQRHFNTSIYITDHKIGMYCTHKNNETLNKATEIELEEGTVKLGYIKEPYILYKQMKKAFKKMKLRPKNIKWVIPDANILIRKIHILKIDIENSNLDKYIKGEIGVSIKHPFKQATFSYFIKEETDVDYNIIIYIADQYLIEDYLDIFEKCKINEIHYDLISTTVNQLLSKNSQIDNHALVISLQNSMLTINIIENQTTIFGMIDELTEETNSIENIAEYIERIANYYQFNIQKGKHSIKQVIVLDLTNKNSYFTRIPELKKIVLERFSFLYLDFKTLNPTLSGYGPNVDVAYISSTMMTVEPKNPVVFEIERAKRGLIFTNYMLVLAIAIISFTSLIYIPFTTMQSNISYQEAINESLSIQQNMVLNSIDNDVRASQNQIEYNQIYESLSSLDSTVYNHLQELLDLLGDETTINNFVINTETKMIELEVSGPDRNTLYEYIISIYENHGVLEETTTERWITAYPEFELTSTTTMRVVIYYA